MANSTRKTPSTPELPKHIRKMPMEDFFKLRAAKLKEYRQHTGKKEKVLPDSWIHFC